MSVEKRVFIYLLLKQPLKFRVNNHNQYKMVDKTWKIKEWKWKDLKPIASKTLEINYFIILNSIIKFGLYIN